MIIPKGISNVGLNKKGISTIKLFCFMIIMCHAMNSYAQSCFDYITLSTQSEVDNFPSNYPGCTNWTGSITISGSDITDLTPLNELVSAFNLEIINNPLLQDLEGLNNLVNITTLIISSNPTITNCNGLNGLNWAESIEINDCISLTDLNGLSSLQY